MHLTKPVFVWLVFLRFSSPVFNKRSYHPCSESRAVKAKAAPHLPLIRCAGNNSLKTMLVKDRLVIQYSTQITKTMAYRTLRISNVVCTSNMQHMAMLVIARKYLKAKNTPGIFKSFGFQCVQLISLLLKVIKTMLRR